MEGLVLRSTVAAAQLSGRPARDFLGPPSLRVGQQLQQSQQCGCGMRLKRLRLRHSLLRASIRDVERMLRSGDIQTIAPQNAQSLLSDKISAYKLLDVRPMWEREKAYVAESIHVPLFVEDEATDAMTLLKKQIQFGFGGAWLGQRFTKQNMNFVAQVEEALPSKNDKIMVACGEGMRLGTPNIWVSPHRIWKLGRDLPTCLGFVRGRSMMAIEELRKAGYGELAWLGGGFNNVRDGDFITVENGTKLQWATVGGASELFLKFAVLLSSVSNSISGSSAVKDE